MKRLSWLLVGALVPLVGPVAGLTAAHAQAPRTLVRASFVDYPKEHPGPRVKPPGRGGTTCGLPATDLCTDFKDGRFRWSHLPVDYYVNRTSAPSGLSGFAAAVDAAFATWQKETKSSAVAAIYGDDESSISYADRGTSSAVGAVSDGRNVVSFADLSATCNRCIAVTTYWYYLGSRTLAEFDMTLNSALPWSTSGAAGAYDVENIATHEAGHTLVLADLYTAQDAALTMYGYGSLGEVSKDTLGAGDVLGVRKAYPAG